MRKLDVYVSSQVGLVRGNNEDMVLAGRGLHRDADWMMTGICLSDSDRYIVAVCDGMGGQNAGEVASEDVASQLSDFFSKLPSGLDMEALVKRLDVWQADEHEYLTQRGLEEMELMNMGTTLVSWIYYEGKVFWANSGDSRLYRLRNGVLEQLTTDHSLYNVTKRMEDSHIILNCLGGGCEGSYLEIQELTDDFHKGDLYMLCSDGLTDMVSDELIQDILNSGGRAQSLTATACQAGGVDNVSVCIVEISAS